MIRQKIWEIYRGDEFQIRIAAEKALEMAIQIKALIKTTKNLDVRIGIGLGDEDFRGAGVSESNGSAYQRSGRTLSLLKERKINLAIATGDPEFRRYTEFNAEIRVRLYGFLECCFRRDYFNGPGKSASFSKGGS